VRGGNTRANSAQNNREFRDLPESGFIGIGEAMGGRTPGCLLRLSFRRFQASPVSRIEAMTAGIRRAVRLG